MKKLLGILAGTTLLAGVGATQAATLGPDLATNGLTYNFSIIGGALNSTSATFDVHITGINVVGTDAILGRSGINAFAFTTANLPNILSGSTTLVGATFQSGGLNSGGCNGSGGFFCFGNTNVAGTPALASGTVIDIDLHVEFGVGQLPRVGPSVQDRLERVAEQLQPRLRGHSTRTNGTPFSNPPGETPASGCRLAVR